jgi:hypothetical protein
MSKLFPILNTISIYIVFAGLLWCTWKKPTLQKLPRYLFFIIVPYFLCGNSDYRFIFCDIYIWYILIKKPQIHISANNMLLAGFCLILRILSLAHTAFNSYCDYPFFLALAFLLEDLVITING